MIAPATRGSTRLVLKERNRVNCWISSLECQIQLKAYGVFGDDLIQAAIHLVEVEGEKSRR